MKTKIINTPDMLKAASRRKEATVFVPASFDKKEELQALVKEHKNIDRPLFIDVHVRQGIRKDMPKLNIDHKAQKRALMENLIGE